MEKRAMLEGNGEAYTLQATHAVLDRRVKELDRRAILTPKEQMELSDLKKMRLQVKDQMHGRSW